MHSFFLTLAWQAVIALIGSTLLLIGVALLVLPGPGWLIIIGGLVVLGSEFLWARRLLKKVKHEVVDAKRMVRKSF